jgi:Domain of unknown function (DUF4172)
LTYIHERPAWPEFTWDSEALAGALAAVRHKQGKHLGKMEALGFDLCTEANVTALTDEVVKSPREPAIRYESEATAMQRFT